MTEKTLTTENIKPALDALRGELAPWPVVAKKQDRLNTAQLNAANSGITSSLVAQIIANTAAIRALESAITGTGLRALVVSSLPAIGTQGILYIVPVTTYDPETDADVVNYSNEYIWIPVEGGTASEGHYEQVGQTGIVINNGQLTITVNGTSVGTFTANQSGDTTAAITVPTNADYVDRTTDQTVAGDKTWTGEQSFTLPIVGSITGTASKAIADEDGTSIKTGYVNVAGNQTVSGDKSFTGSNTFNSILPNATNTYSLGSSSYQWSSVYAQTYFYNGTAWGLDKANTWTGTNTYTKIVTLYNSDDTQSVPALYLRNSKAELSSSGNTSSYQDISFRDKNDTPYAYIRSSVQSNGSILNLKTLTKDSNNNSVENTIQIISFINGTKALLPVDSGTDLGNSNYKWKTLNGVNPGALSLPNKDKRIAIDTTGWTYTGNYANQILINNATQTISGWLYIRIENTTVSDYVTIRMNSVSIDNPTFIQPGSSATPVISVLFPVVAGIPVYVYATKAPAQIYLYECLGNV